MTWPVRAWNALASDRPDLDAERLIQGARQKTGLQHFGTPSVEDALEVLVDALNRSARLSAFGRTSTRGLLQNLLVQRLCLNHVDAKDEPIEKPVIIASPPRTGSTFLLNLLACMPDLRTLRHWEANYPVQLPATAGNRVAKARTSRRLAALAELMGQRSLMPELTRIHRFQLEGPEECTWLLMGSFRSNAFSLVYNIPDYERWLFEDDGAASCAVHSRSLQLLGAQGKRWLLKSPFHLGRERALADQYPGALFIRTVRDPAEVVASFCSMAESYRRLSAQNLDRAAIGRQVLRFVMRDWKRARAAQAELAKEQLMRITLRDLGSRPLETVHEIAARAGLTIGSETESNMKLIVTKRRQRLDTPHTYSLEDYGLTRSEVERALA